MLADRLPTLAEKKVMPFPEFNHLDFLYANDAKTIVYDDVISFLKRYDRKYDANVKHSKEVDANIVHPDFIDSNE